MRRVGLWCSARSVDLKLGDLKGRELRAAYPRHHLAFDRLGVKDEEVYNVVEDSKHPGYVIVAVTIND